MAKLRFITIRIKFRLKIYKSLSFVLIIMWLERNRPFPSSLVALFHNESKCRTFHMNMSSSCSFMQIKVIFVRIVSHLDSL